MEVLRPKPPLSEEAQAVAVGVIVAVTINYMRTGRLGFREALSNIRRPHRENEVFPTPAQKADWRRIRRQHPWEVITQTLEEPSPSGK